MLNRAPYIVRASTFALFLCVAQELLAGEEGTRGLARSALGDIVLRDTRGGEVRLPDPDKARFVVLAFLGAECPLARLYLPRLEELHQRYRERDVVIWGIDANRQDTLDEIDRLAREHQVTFPILKDPGNVVADRMGAVRTPEVFVLDSDRVVRYRGRIDDQYGVDYQRPEPLRSDLAVAVDELLKGESVSKPETEAVGCFIGREQAPAEQGDVTWSSHIAAIVQEHCQECHRPGQLAPLSLLTYDDLLGWGPTIAEVTSNRRMPPWHADPSVGRFSNENRLTDDEVELIGRWVELGCPEGDPTEAPPPRNFPPSGWRAIEPDLVLYMSESSFAVPAEGVLDYQQFTVDPGLAEGKWVRAVECRPGNPLVVHHMDIFLQWPGEERPDELRDLFGGFAPGAHPWIWPEGTAKYVPPGGKFVFQMHYTPNGSPQVDRSSMGLEFVREEEVAHAVVNGTAINLDFVIPPETSDYVVEASYRVAEDARLLTLTPHMHYRGRKFRFEAIFPDGRRQPLLDVPNFDFNWQTTYRLARPLPLPAGTEVHCVAHFDNSSANRSNPDSSVPVGFGYQTFEEMMIGYFEMAAENRALRRSPVVHHFGPPPVGSKRWIWAALAATTVLAVAVWSTVSAVRRARRAAP